MPLAPYAKFALLTQALCLPWLFFILPFMAWLLATWAERWTRMILSARKH